MARLTFEITMSLDGYVAGPNMTPDQGLGEGGEQLHEWAFDTAAWHEEHGGTGGSGQRRLARGGRVCPKCRRAHHGAPDVRRRGRVGQQAWGDQPWEGWWGDEPPFHTPVFVLTTHPREPLVKGETTFTFVTDGIESALTQAQAAAGGEDVMIAGGANVFQQYLKAGLVDDFQVHVVPQLLGKGVRLFDDLGRSRPCSNARAVLHSPAVTHLRYRVVKVP